MRPAGMQRSDFFVARHHAFTLASKNGNRSLFVEPIEPI